jgi:hypothetical protein
MTEGMLCIKSENMKSGEELTGNVKESNAGKRNMIRRNFRLTAAHAPDWEGEVLFREIPEADGRQS